MGKTYKIYTRTVKGGKAMARTFNGLYKTTIKRPDDVEKLAAEKLVNTTYGKGAEATSTGNCEVFGKAANDALWDEWEVTRA